MVSGIGSLAEGVWPRQEYFVGGSHILFWSLRLGLQAVCSALVVLTCLGAHRVGIHHMWVTGSEFVTVQCFQTFLAMYTV